MGVDCERMGVGESGFVFDQNNRTYLEEGVQLRWDAGPVGWVRKRPVNGQILNIKITGYLLT